MTMHIAEADWKQLRKLSPLALERLAGRALDDVRRIAAGQGTNHERYLKVFDLIRERDKEIALAFDDLRRSNALPKLAAMRRLQLLTSDEFEGFSNETRAVISRML